MPLKFREIEVFWAVYKAQSVKEAARILNVSQPAVSMMLKSAEERSGLKLFDRAGGRLKPTSEARALFTATDSVFTELKDFERQLVRVKEGRADFIRIAGTPTLLTAFVEPALAGFHARHPAVCVVVRTAPTDRTIAYAAAGDIDFGIAYGPADYSDTNTDTLVAAEVACVLRADHRLAEKALIVPADLKGESVMSYRSDTPIGREMERTLRHAGVDLHFAVQSTAITAAHIASRGMGVALIDPFVLNAELFGGLTVRPFKPTVRAQVQIVTPRNDPLSLTCQDLLAQIRTFVPKQFFYEAPIRAAPLPRATLSRTRPSRR